MDINSRPSILTFALSLLSLSSFSFAAGATATGANRGEYLAVGQNALFLIDSNKPVVMLRCDANQKLAVAIINGALNSKAAETEKVVRSAQTLRERMAAVLGQGNEPSGRFYNGCTSLLKAAFINDGVEDFINDKTNFSKAPILLDVLNKTPQGVLEVGVADFKSRIKNLSATLGGDSSEAAMATESSTPMTLGERLQFAEQVCQTMDAYPVVLQMLAPEIHGLAEYVCMSKAATGSRGTAESDIPLRLPRALYENQEKNEEEQPQADQNQIPSFTQDESPGI